MGRMGGGLQLPFARNFDASSEQPRKSFFFDQQDGNKICATTVYIATWIRKIIMLGI